MLQGNDRCTWPMALAHYHRHLTNASMTEPFLNTVFQKRQSQGRRLVHLKQLWLEHTQGALSWPPNSITAEEPGETPVKTSAVGEQA